MSVLVKGDKSMNTLSDIVRLPSDDRYNRDGIKNIAVESNRVHCHVGFGKYQAGDVDGVPGYRRRMIQSAKNSRRSNDVFVHVARLFFDSDEFSRKWFWSRDLKFDQQIFYQIGAMHVAEHYITESLIFAITGGRGTYRRVNSFSGFECRDKICGISTDFVNHSLPWFGCQFSNPTDNS